MTLASPLMSAGRLMLDLERRETWAEYVSGFNPGMLATGSVIELLEAAAMRGRGGAGFPSAIKWRAVADHDGTPVVIANGEEGEPGSIKDRYLLRRRPHLVLDGLLLARTELGADRAIVYLSDEVAELSVKDAISERPECADVEVIRVSPAYVAGEESAIVRSINEGIALPTQKPPRPCEVGVDGRPTLIQNVETLAYIAWLVRHGVPEGGHHTFLATITGACFGEGLLELEFGQTLGEAINLAGGDADTARGVLIGGYFGGLMNRDAFDLPLDYDAMREAGTGLGCAAFMVLGQEHCPVATVAAVVRYLAGESSGQCGSCVNGTAAMADALERIRDGAPEDEDTERLQRWSVQLKGRGACGLIDGAAHQVAVLFKDFPDEIQRHHDGQPCERCEGLNHQDWIRPDIDRLLGNRKERTVS